MTSNRGLSLGLWLALAAAAGAGGAADRPPPVTPPAPPAYLSAVVQGDGKERPLSELLEILKERGGLRYLAPADLLSTTKPVTISDTEDVEQTVRYVLDVATKQAGVAWEVNAEGVVLIKAGAGPAPSGPGDGIAWGRPAAGSRRILRPVERAETIPGATLQLGISLARTTVAPAEPLRITFHFRNTGERAQKVILDDRASLNVGLQALDELPPDPGSKSREDGPWGAGLGTAGRMAPVELAPGAITTREVTTAPQFTYTPPDPPFIGDGPAPGYASRPPVRRALPPGRYRLRAGYYHAFSYNQHSKEFLPGFDPDVWQGRLEAAAVVVRIGAGSGDAEAISKADAVFFGRVASRFLPMGAHPEPGDAGPAFRYTLAAERIWKGLDPKVPSATLDASEVPLEEGKSYLFFARHAYPAQVASRPDLRGRLVATPPTREAASVEALGAETLALLGGEGERVVSLCPVCGRNLLDPPPASVTRYRCTGCGGPWTRPEPPPPRRRPR